MLRQKCIYVTVFLVFIIGVYCTPVKSDGELTEDVRSPREFESDDLRATDQEKWKAVQYHNPENQDWIPAEPPVQSSILGDDEEEPILKRRRPGRKRKRRPQNPDREYLNDEDHQPDRSRSRPRRPQRLDQRREQWRDEMMSEEPFRPIRNYNRRRLYPKYDEEEEPEPQPVVQRKNPYLQEDNFEYQPPQSVPIIDDNRKIDIPVEKIRDPYTALNQEQTKRRRPYSKRKYLNRNQDETEEQATDRIDNGSPNSLNLKALLKQSGGISLSELLQQKNLSLADLLKGEQHAISALTELPEKSTDAPIIEEEVEEKPHNRRLPSIRKHPKQDAEDDFTTISPQKKRISLFNTNKETKYSNLLTESTTERRIFVPSHPKYYTSVDYKPNMKVMEEEITTKEIPSTELPEIVTKGISTTREPEKITTTVLPEKTSESISIVSSTVTFSTSENPTTVKTKKIQKTGRLPPTLAKLKKLTAKTTMASVTRSETENYPKISSVPINAIKIDIHDLFGMKQLFNITTTTEGPMKISVDIENLNEDEKDNSLNENIIKNEPFQKYEKQNEKLKQLTAKDEIMEVLSDTLSRENLTKVLEARNMTVEQLVEQRERGSSQRHLADIFHNQTKEPEPPEEMIVEEKLPKSTFFDPPSLFDTFPVFDNQAFSNVQVKPSAQTKYLSSGQELPSITRESRQNQFSDSDDYNLVSNPIYGVPNEKSHAIINKIMPLWQQAYTNINRNHETDKQDEILNDEAHRIEEIENKLAEVVNGALNVEQGHQKTYSNIYEEESEFFRLPYGVRSAIVASGAIIGISIIIFLTIFIIFKLTQKHRRQLAYTNSFSGTKIKSPILAAEYQSRLFGSIMNATLGRKKKMTSLSFSEPHSFQDYSWDNNDRKPFQ